MRRGVGLGVSWSQGVGESVCGTFDLLVGRFDTEGCFKAFISVDLVGKTRTAPFLDLGCRIGVGGPSTTLERR